MVDNGALDEQMEKARSEITDPKKYQS